MSLKWIKVIATFGIFLLCFLVHFMYTIFPNALFSIFFPVNESIWEHMKMLFTAIILYGIIDYLILKKTHRPYHNYLVNLFITGFLSIPIFLIIYLPIYSFTGENMALNFIILFITISITQIISYYILKSEKYRNLNYVSLIGIVLVYIIMGILTYYPFLNDLFFDPVDEKYGINTYSI